MTKHDGERLERFLAALYTDEATRASFVVSPRDVAMRAGLVGDELERVCALDQAGLALAAESLARKRVR
jgi:hypothetical protein